MQPPDNRIAMWRLALALAALLAVAGCRGGSTAPYDQGCEFDPYCVSSHGG